MKGGEVASRRLNAPRRDVRVLAFALLALAVVALSHLVTLIPGRGIEASVRPARPDKNLANLFPRADTKTAPEQAPRNELDVLIEPAVDPRLDPEGHVRHARSVQAAAMLAEGAALMETGRFDEAVQIIDQAGQLVPDNPVAYVYMGRALKGRGDYHAAQFFFERAMDLDPLHADAYFGYAQASEGLGDLESALGAMRSFLHVVDDPDPFRLPVAQARSAIWEWEAELGRGPWGPTRGIPPGFTAEEVRRDGRGVGVKMQKADTMSEDGTMEFEIKAGDRIPDLFKP